MRKILRKAVGTILSIMIVTQIFQTNYAVAFAAENPAKHTDGMRADAFISFQSCNLARADVVCMNQCVLRHALFAHGFPQRLIRNHAQTSRPKAFEPIDILTDYGI